MDDLSKKRRLKKRIKESRRERAIRAGCDCHHIFYQRRYWKGGFIGEFRMFWYNRLYIPKDTIHKDIHLRVAQVPVPSVQSIKAAREQLRALESSGAIKESDTIGERLRVLIGLFEQDEIPTADALRAQLEVVERFENPS